MPKSYRWIEDDLLRREARKGTQGCKTARKPKRRRGFLALEVLQDAGISLGSSRKVQRTGMFTPEELLALGLDPATLLPLDF